MSEKIPPIERTSGVPQAALAERHDVAEPLRATPEAARQILAEQLPILHVVARGLCRDATEREELVQDVYEKALRAISRIDLASNPRGWMVTILHNLHIDRCRKRARMKPHIPSDDVAIPAPEVIEAPAWSGLSSDDVRRAVAKLPDELRTTYTMFALDGQSYHDVAQTLGIPKATVGTRISRARARLKALLTAEIAGNGGDR